MVGIPPTVRPSGRCTRCGRTVLLTVQGKLFLHGERPYKPAKGTRPAEWGERCKGGMTTDFEPAGEQVKRKVS